MFSICNDWQVFLLFRRYSVQGVSLLLNAIYFFKIIILGETMNLSLIENFLPPSGSVERLDIEKNTIIGANDIKGWQRLGTKNNKIGRFILTIVQETALAILTNQYKQFDALIKNFGCQITALNLYMSCRDLKDEAASIHQLAMERLEKKTAKHVPKEMLIF